MSCAPPWVLSAMQTDQAGQQIVFSVLMSVDGVGCHTRTDQTNASVVKAGAVMHDAMCVWQKVTWLEGKQVAAQWRPPPTLPTALSRNCNRQHTTMPRGNAVPQDWWSSLATTSMCWQQRSKHKGPHSEPCNDMIHKADMSAAIAFSALRAS